MTTNSIADFFVSSGTRFAGDQKGATAIEYGLVASGISLTIATAVWTLGEIVLTELFQKMANALFSV